jgi:Cation transporter/ATPase, N-terminus
MAPVAATSAGRDVDFPVTCQELSDIMRSRGDEAKVLIEQKYGGLLELCKKLRTSPNEGLSARLFYCWTALLWTFFQLFFQFFFQFFLQFFSNFFSGLPGTEEDAERRRDVYGSNVIPPKPPKAFLKLVWEALQDVTLIILEVAAVISLILSFIHFKDEEGTSAGHLTPAASLTDLFDCRYVSCNIVFGDFSAFFIFEAPFSYWIIACFLPLRSINFFIFKSGTRDFSVPK